MKHPPTDLSLLREIYKSYYDSFVAYSEGIQERETKVYVTIDVDAVAEKFGVDGDIVFGRLYYHLNHKHGYRNDDGSYVQVFARVAGKDRHCVNFPLVASLLADLENENKKFWWATGIAIFSLIVSIISLVISVYA